jgi:Ricin-type beta-trefoil lectin domain
MRSLSAPAAAAEPSGRSPALAPLPPPDTPWTISSFGGSQDTGLSMTPGGSPSITSARVGAVAGFATQCMDVAGANPENGTQVQLYTCNDTSAQTWAIAADSTIRALGKCLDVGGTSIPVRIWDCNGTGAQVWQLTRFTQLFNPQSGECLHATGSANSTPLQIAPCDSATKRQLATQQWFLPPESSWTVTP